MALTDAQKADVRRWMGYPQVGTNVSVGPYHDFAYGWVLPGVWETLVTLLDNLSSENETILVNKFLVKLDTLEDAITTASDNLDTSSAAVWVHNPNEIDDRFKLYRKWRLELCSFLGIAPGPYLTQGNQIIRC
jgi:hypothetical protein